MGIKNDDDLSLSYPQIVGMTNTSKTAPTSPLQKKFKFNPQVSSIRNQRHSVVSIAMIQKIRQNKSLLEAQHKTNTPSISINSHSDINEEYENEQDMADINVSYYNNDQHITPTPTSSQDKGDKNHSLPWIQRSGTEDDILHHQTKQEREKRRSGKMKKYRNGVQSTKNSPKHSAV